MSGPKQNEKKNGKQKKKVALMKTVCKYTATVVRVRDIVPILREVRAHFSPQGKKSCDGLHACTRVDGHVDAQVDRLTLHHSLARVYTPFACSCLYTIRSLVSIHHSLARVYTPLARSCLYTIRSLVSIHHSLARVYTPFAPVYTRVRAACRSKARRPMPTAPMHQAFRPRHNCIGP